MGIQGLKKYLKDKNHPVFFRTEWIPDGSYLHVDALGWMFHLMQSPDGLEMARQCGGSYIAFDSLIRKSYYDLINFRFKVIFYLDGASSTMKAATRKERDEKRAESWMALYNSLCNVDWVDQMKLDLPPLTIQQFVHSLNALGCDIIRCPYEADQFMALRSVEQSDQSHFCYGEDTDFLVMKDCSYIAFGTIKADVKSLCTAVVWRRKKLSKALQMSEEQFLEWCILIGNDYTKQYEKSLFDGYISNGSPTSLERLRKFIISKGTDFRLSSENTDLDAAIRYSRATYNLCNLKPLETASESRDNGRHDASAEVKDNEIVITAENIPDKEKYSLSASQKQCFRAWLEANANSSLTTDTGQKVLMFLRSNLSNHQSLVDTGEETAPINLFHEVEGSHLDALSDMQKEISARIKIMNEEEMAAALSKLALNIGDVSKTVLKSKAKAKAKVRNGNGNQKQNSNQLNLLWSDVLASRTYQLLCKLVSGRDEASLNPMEIYDGDMFHAAAAVKRMTVIRDTTDKTAQDLLTAQNKQQAPPVKQIVKIAMDELPIDKYRESILQRISSDRVTVIQGGTGCGKSSRLPVMLMEEAERKGIPCRIMVSQPRRIAASSLMRRLRPSLGFKVGLRLGQGLRDESTETVLHFVTCGYLVRLMAHHPNHFKYHTHIIIDEVHERSIDADLLCMFTRQLLDRFPSIRLVLMSATLHTDLYKDYFSKFTYPLEPLFVGVKRFGIEYKYVNDVIAMAKQSKVPNNLLSLFEVLNKSTARCRGAQTEKLSYVIGSAQLQAAVFLVSHIAKEGSDILIFVSGLKEIQSLSHSFEKKRKYQLCHIHSEIPYEDQRLAFEKATPGKIKLIIANNTAVSSVTFPDVDTVICLGAHKAMHYEAETHLVYLADTWISKATATQRAGRTGRVRPGTVYRLYSESLFDKFDEYDESEILRSPLQDVILDVWSMSEHGDRFHGIIPTLYDLPEPPMASNIDFSLRILNGHGMITEHTGQGELTSLGRFAGALPLDLRLGTLIHYGIALGVGAEAVIFAAALSLDRSIFKKTNFILAYRPRDFNNVVRNSFLGAAQLDQGSYCEPVMYLNAYRKWITLNETQQIQWARIAGIQMDAMNRFVMLSKDLMDKTERALRNSSESIDFYAENEDEELGSDSGYRLDFSALHLDHITTPKELNYYRLIITWISADNIVRQDGLDKTDKEAPFESTVSVAFSRQSIQNLYPNIDMISIKNDRKVKNGVFSIPFNIKYQGITRYKAYFSDARTYLSKADLVGALILSYWDSLDHHSHCDEELPFVWIVQDPTISPDDFDGSETDAQRKAASTVLILSYPRNCDALKRAALYQLLSFCGSVKARPLTPSADDVIESDGLGSLGANCSDEFDLYPLSLYDLLEVVNIPLAVLAKLEGLYGQSAPVASVKIPALGEKIFTAANYSPLAESVAYVFFAGERERDGDRNGVCTSHSALRQVITFTDINALTGVTDVQGRAESLRDPSHTPHAQEEGKEEKEEDKEDDESEIPDTSLAVIRQINDVPLGLRLMNSYRIPHANAMVQISGSEVDQININGDSYMKNGERNGESSTSYSIKRIAVGGSIPGWQMVGMSTPTYLPRHSLGAVAVHRGDESLYGVAFRTFLVEIPLNHKKVCLTEGVILLPPGGLWVSLALSCVGRNPQAIVRHESIKYSLEQRENAIPDLNEDHQVKKQKKKKGKKKGKMEDKVQGVAGITKFDFSSCSAIEEYLKALTTLPLHRDDFLIAAVDYLFAQWQVT